MEDEKRTAAKNLAIERISDAKISKTIQLRIHQQQLFLELRSKCNDFGSPLQEMH
jgi:hypothetical protein